MLVKTFLLNNKVGLYTKPSTVLSETASRYVSDIQIEYNGRSVDAKSIMGVLSLAVPSGKEVIVRIAGEDDRMAMEEIKKLFETEFVEITESALCES
ncbi:HPr family phosphocarrier protein [Caldibacillus lycopersici]|uniref:HPr family phosphocarrier protein n=1 Tax=Perspicuibacillus lycopersici TaxID=1325689 RepID=A0AAE3IRY5_9BACI|nr:HPr family phosphocarrier protein [Perspicuibacillus lycopersici]MCU9613112.1 HPr family phosphocarrier protein [Perspicuibacillus lycopersici]